MRNKLILLIILVFSPLSDGVAQQLSQLTMFNNSLILYNPAYTGSENALSLSLFHRSQWSGLDGAPSSQALLAHTPVFNNMALGLSIYNDRLGPHDNFKVTGNYSFKIMKDETNYFSFGAQVGYFNQRADYASISDDSFEPSDPQLQGIMVKQGSPEFGAGFALVKPRFELAMSALNLAPFKSDIDDTYSVKLSRTNYFLYSKLNIEANPKLTILPSILLKYVNDLPVSFDVSTHFWYKNLVMAGLNYRKSESLSLALQVKPKPQLTVGFAHDWLVGEVSSISNGSNEFVVQYVFKYTEKLSSPR